MRCLGNSNSVVDFEAPDEKYSYMGKLGKTGVSTTWILEKAV